jgi:hypothetical protein
MSIHVTSRAGRFKNQEREVKRRDKYVEVGNIRISSRHKRRDTGVVQLLSDGGCSSEGCGFWQLNFAKLGPRLETR